MRSSPANIIKFLPKKSIISFSLEQTKVKRVPLGIGYATLQLNEHLKNPTLVPLNNLIAITVPLNNINVHIVSLNNINVHIVSLNNIMCI